MTIQQRKEAVAKSLFKQGESGYARDFLESNEAESFQTLEDTMRKQLKDAGPGMPASWSKAVANAIVECQCIPRQPK